MAWRLFQLMRNRPEPTASGEPLGGTTVRTSDLLHWPDPQRAAGPARPSDESRSGPSLAVLGCRRIQDSSGPLKTGLDQTPNFPSRLGHKTRRAVSLLTASGPRAPPASANSRGRDATHPDSPSLRSGVVAVPLPRSLASGASAPIHLSFPLSIPRCPPVRRRRMAEPCFAEPGLCWLSRAKNRHSRPKEDAQAAARAVTLILAQSVKIKSASNHPKQVKSSLYSKTAAV